MSSYLSIFVIFLNRQAITNDERIKSGLDFLYDAPPGFNKGKLFVKNVYEFVTDVHVINLQFLITVHVLNCFLFTSI